MALNASHVLSAVSVLGQRIAYLCSVLPEMCAADQLSLSPTNYVHMATTVLAPPSLSSRTHLFLKPTNPKSVQLAHSVWQALRQATLPLITSRVPITV